MNEGETNETGTEAPKPLYAQDMALAAACLQRHAPSIQELERTHLRAIGDFIARIDSSPAFAEEVRQAVREKLLMPSRTGKPPKLTEYAGRGPLGGWIRVVAVRTAIDLRRAAGAPNESEEIADRVVSVSCDPELELLRANHRGPWKEALDAAFARLSPRERNVLRLHYADGWSLDRLAATYKVHRATVARWIASGKEAVLADVAAHLGEGLGLSAGEIHSVTRLLGSQLDVSLSRLGP